MAAQISRSQKARRASRIGIAINLCLFGFKFLSGWLSGSVSVAADALNSLSDAMTSTVSLLGFSLADRPPDREHPYGHGRYEYIAGFVVAAAILTIGFQLLSSGISRILHPQPVAWRTITLAALLASIAGKLFLAWIDFQTARQIDSQTLRAAALDSLSDVGTSTAVLVGILIGRFTPYHLDGLLACFVSVLILYGGIGILRDTISPLLGRMPSREETIALRRTLSSYPGVLGVHDLMIHDYGPSHLFASAHVELPAEWSSVACHNLLDRMERDLEQARQIQIVLHCDPVSIDDPALPKVGEALREEAKAICPGISVHDIRIVGGDVPNVVFDCVLPYGYSLAQEALNERFASALTQALDKPVHCQATVEYGYTEDE